MLIGALVEEVAYEDHLVHFGGSTATDGTLQRTELDSLEACNMPHVSPAVLEFS